MFMILDSMPVGAFVIDHEWQVLFWNRCMEDWTGILRQHIVGTALWQHYPHLLDASYTSRLNAVFEQAMPIILSSYLHQRLIPVTLPNQRLQIQHTTVMPLIYPSDDIVYALFTLEDVTELSERTSKYREMYRQSMLAEQAAESANRAKSAFLANMSHELRTPLNAALSAIEAMQEGIFGSLMPRQQHALGIIEDSNRHLLSLINDILDLSKLEADKLKLEPDWFLIDDVCQSALLMVKEIAYKKSLQVDYQPAPRGCEMWGDQRRIKQVLVNLLSNAVKFTAPHGNIELLVAYSADDGVVRFSVSDTGIGISKADQALLFQPFSQIDDGLNRLHEGTGLGLMLVYRLTTMQGGCVLLESEPGQGSQFHVFFPLPDSPHQVEVSNDSAASVPQINPQARILVADDQPANTEILVQYLHAYQYRVELVCNGEEVLHSVMVQPPDLILMDILMPVMDGLEAIRRLRLNPLTQNIPIIAISALAMEGDRDKCLAAGASAYLSKPIQLKELIRLIGLLLANQPTRPAQA